jgi:predicted DNA-binding transcriptional regulator YafY
MKMMTVLQSKKYVPAEKLAGKFDISLRTVYRDVKALNEIGVPVGFEPAKGYCIAQGFFLPPLSFTTEEANALILLQTLAGRFTDSSIIKHSQSAMEKIRATLRYHDKNNAEQTISKTSVFVPVNEKNDTSWLADIQQSIARQNILNIGYKDTKGTKTNRNIEPIGLLFYNQQWHLIAWCQSRKDYRDFIVNRITSVILTNASFSKEHNFSVADYMKNF